MVSPFIGADSRKESVSEYKQSDTAKVLLFFFLLVCFRYEGWDILEDQGIKNFWDFDFKTSFSTFRRVLLSGKIGFGLSVRGTPYSSW